VRPAQERFERDDLARREQQARLIVEFQLIILQRLAQLLLPVEACERCQTQRVGIESDGALVALPPAGIECRERTFDELDRTRTIGARESHADLRRKLEDLPVEIDRVLERRHERVNDRIGIGTRTNVGQHHTDDIVGNSRNTRQVGATLGQVFDDDLGGGLEHTIRKPRIEHALIGDVAADVDQRHAHGVFT
jgi:hypothetical protein